MDRLGSIYIANRLGISRSAAQLLIKKNLITVNGKLISEDIINKVVEEKIPTFDDDKYNILDGYPRTLSQGQSFDFFLKNNGNKIEKVVYFSIADEEIFQRLVGRFVCVECGAVYHKANNKPLKENECNFCGSTEFVVREDDKESVVKKRIKVFHDETLPLVEYYKQQGILTEIDAAKSVESINNKLLEIVSL